ncbi:MAG: TM0106 family RecB-like putative nuclease [Acidobacteriota bacterium]
MPSATDLANFVRCSHRVFLDTNGDRSAALPPSAELQRMWEEGRQHEEEIVGSLDAVAAEGTTPDERRESTKRLMAAGVPLIYHATLQKGDLVGEPDLLKRIDGPSDLGTYSYAPVDVKLGRATKTATGDTTKTEYAVQLCAYAELLEHAQGVRPQIGWIVDHRNDWREVDLSAFANLYGEIRRTFAAVQSGERPTIPGWKNSACPQCAWRDRCWRVLRETDDLTTMPAIGIPKREKLWAIGIRTVWDLAAADPNMLASTKGLGRAARSWPLRARTMKAGMPTVISPWTAPVVDFEISYDVENLTDPFVYLHGLLIRPSGSTPFGDPKFADTDFGSFEPVCAASNETEESVWRRFLVKIEALVKLGSFSVLIYSPHERSVLRRLRTQFGGSDALTQFESAIIDLCKVVRRSVVLPIDGDGLKSVAQFINFHWRDASPGGAQSITWWKAYLQDPRQLSAKDK